MGLNEPTSDLIQIGYRLVYLYSKIYRTFLYKYIGHYCLIGHQFYFISGRDDEDDFTEYFPEPTAVDGGEEGEEKEKGVPAVMRCFDRAKIFVKTGDGRDGVVAFRQEKFVPFGGPSGDGGGGVVAFWWEKFVPFSGPSSGDGGRGGCVHVEVDESMNSLLPFRKNVHFKAGRGVHGQGSKQAGHQGSDVFVKVPPGTVIRESMKGAIEGEVLLELMQLGQSALLLPGGRGGRDKASFKSGTLRVPKIAENGEEGAEM